MIKLSKQINAISWIDDYLDHLVNADKVIKLVDERDTELAKLLRSAMKENRWDLIHNIFSHLEEA